MNRQTAVCASFLLSTLLSSTSLAGGFGKVLFPQKCWPNCITVACCDDYCPKPLPCIKQVDCFTGDDYCRKSVPCVPTVTCFKCDDYCKKCPPRLICPPYEHLRCPPSQPCDCGSGASKPRIR